jgi:putative endonuclease
MIALVWLLLRGYRILARHYRAPGGEIDLIVRKGDMIAFVEVKARDDLALAAGAITATKQQRINRAAVSWLSQHRHYSGAVFRGDAVCIMPWRLPWHIEDAFALSIHHDAFGTTGRDYRRR